MWSSSYIVMGERLLCFTTSFQMINFVQGKVIKWKSHEMDLSALKELVKNKSYNKTDIENNVVFHLSRRSLSVFVFVGRYVIFQRASQP